MSYVTLHGNRSRLAGLHAFHTADASGLAGLHHHGALVLRDARHVDRPVLGPLLAELDDSLRTGLHAGAAGRALVGIDLGQPRFGVDPDGIEGADRHAVAVAQTAERTARLAHVERRSHGARRGAVEFVGSRTLGARSAAPHGSHLRLLFGGRLTQIIRHGLHAGAAAHRAEERRNVVPLHQRVGHAAATGEAAAAAVRSGEHLLDLVDPRVLLDPEFPGYEVEHHGRENAQRTQCQDRKK